jgi:ribosomal protein S18 acetylase RimI-like enzyme
MFPPLGRSHPRPPEVAEVEDLFVAAGCRSAGVGTRLLAEAERVARSRGYREIGLVVGIENAAAQRLYARLGFEETDLGEFWVEGARTVCRYLVKPL